MKLELLLNRLVPNPEDCRAAAARLREAHPNRSDKELAEQAVHDAKMLAAGAGAATGIASSPLMMIPAALADMAAVLCIEGMLVGVIAALLDPESLNDPKALRTDVMSVVFPAAASQALRQFGIRAGERLSQAAMRKYATEDLLRTLSRLATRYAGKHLTRDAITTKTVPLVGMGIGAGWNWLEVRAIGDRAIRYYSDEPIGPRRPLHVFSAPKRVYHAVRRYLPASKTLPTD